MSSAEKKTFPVSQIRRYLEPGPIVLVSSAWKGHTNIMTMGWHMVMGFSPSLIGCYLWDANHSFEMIRKSKQCVFNIPALNLAKTAVAIGNCSGRSVDKFDKFRLTPTEADKVDAPLIDECHANFECKLHDARWAKTYSLFIFEVVKARARVSPKFPKTFHYRGQGEFMIAGPTVGRYRKGFKPDRL